MIRLSAFVLVVLPIYVSILALPVWAQEEPIQLTARTGHGPGLAVASAGEVALAGDGAHLLTLDLTGADAPIIRGAAKLPGVIYDIAASGGYAYVANGYFGLRIVDITDPAAPEEVGHFELGLSPFGFPPASARAVAVDGSTVYLAIGSAVYLLDVSDPAQPVELSAHADAERGQLTGLDAQDGTLVAAHAAAMYVLDVSDPTNPSAMGEVTFDGYAALGLPVNIEIEGSVAYMADQGNGLHVVDISSASSPQVLATADPAGQLMDYTALAVEGEVAYVAAAGVSFVLGERQPNVAAIDVSDPGAPALIDSGLINAGSARRAVLVGEHLLVAADEYGLRVVSTAPAIGEQSELPLGGRPLHLALSGEHLYVAAQTQLRLLDVAAPTDIFLTGAWEGAAFDVAVDDPYAYVTAGNPPGREPGFTVLDVSNPAQPEPVFEGETPLSHIALTGDLLVGLHAEGRSSSGDRLYVFDRSDPAAPEMKAEVEFDDDLLSLAALGAHTVVSSSGNTTHVMDLTDPTNPRSVATIETERDVRRVAVDGALAYLMTAGGTTVVDLSDTNSPRVVASWAFAGNDLAARDERAYVAGHVFRAIDLAASEPGDLADSWADPRLQETEAVIAEGGLVYATTQQDGLYVFPAAVGTAREASSAMGALELSRPYPNPSRGRVALEFRAPEAQHVEVTLYDVIGRRVRTLFDYGGAAPERRRIAFDVDELPAGLYLIGMRASGRRVTRPLIVQ